MVSSLNKKQVLQVFASNSALAEGMVGELNIFFKNGLAVVTGAAATPVVFVRCDGVTSRELFDPRHDVAAMRRQVWKMKAFDVAAETVPVASLQGALDTVKFRYEPVGELHVEVNALTSTFFVKDFVDGDVVNRFAVSVSGQTVDLHLVNSDAAGERYIYLFRSWAADRGYMQVRRMPSFHMEVFESYLMAELKPADVDLDVWLTS